MSESNAIRIDVNALTSAGHHPGLALRRLIRGGWSSGTAPTDRPGPAGLEPNRTSGAVVRRISGLALAAALFTLSWERFGNVSAGSYNVKLPVILFLLVALLTSPTWIRRGVGLLRVRRMTPVAFVVAVAFVLVAYFIGRAAFAPSIQHGAAAVVSMLTGAVLPALAIVGVVRSRDDLAWACGWIVRGAVLASLFGLYQLLAFYVGLPQIVDYRGVGTDGSTGRIAAFSYEPAYFAYFLVIAIGALITRRFILGRAVSWPWIAYFGIVLALVNVRALMFLLPVFAVLLAFGWRSNRRLIFRGAVVGIALTIISIGAPAVIEASSPGPQSVAASSSATEPTDSSNAATETPGADATVDPPVQAPNPGAVLDPNEATSNAPRLELYKAVLALDLRHPVFGLGPGQLADAIGSKVPTTAGVAVVANNIWLQAGADGGALLVLLEIAFVVGIVVVWYRGRHGFGQALGSSWLAVVLVAGMLTSYFFDLKIWVAAALILVGAGSVRSRVPLTPVASTGPIPSADPSDPSRP